MATPNNIAVPNEVDAYTVELQDDTSYTVIVTGITTGGPGNTLGDPWVGVVETKTTEVVEVKATGELDPILSFEVPSAGDYTIAVGDLTGGTGTYEVGVFDEETEQELPLTFVTEIISDRDRTDPATISVTQKGGVNITNIVVAAAPATASDQLGLMGVPQTDTDTSGLG